MTNPDPSAVWGSLTNQAASPSRYSLVPTGGDKRPKGDGTSQQNEAWRRLELKGTDADPSNPGAEQQRTELGENNANRSFAVFRQGDTRDIWFSVYLDPQYPIANHGRFQSAWDWQLLMQIKSAQPVSGAGNQVDFSVEAKTTYPSGVPKTWFFGPGGTVQTEPPPLAGWIRFHFRIHFDNKAGWWEAEVDNRPNATTWQPTFTLPRRSGATLATNDNGTPAPAHLRLGYYRNKKIGQELSEKASIGSTFVGISNVQVYEVE